MSKSKYLDWQDAFVSCFVDYNKYLVVFVSDCGMTEVLNFDSNFYTIEEDIVAYDNMLRHSSLFDRQGNADQKEYMRYLRRYVRHVKRKIPEDEELNLEYLRFMGIKL